MPKVTVFTPTYNRAYILEKLYRSLTNQTNKDFEWLIIDDGSTDNTYEIVKAWLEEDNIFEIKYVKKENGGKHRAVNLSLELARGDLYIIVDSDDYLTNDAIEKIIEKEKTISGKDRFVGIVFNRGSLLNNKIHGKTFKGDYIDATALQRRKYNIMGDKAEVYYTRILKKYKFPEFEGENFITENVVWLKIANDGYKHRFYNDVIYLGDYLQGGLTDKAVQLEINNFKGYTHYISEALKYKLTFVDRLTLIGVYTRTAKIKGLKYKEISGNIHTSILFCVILHYASKISRLIKDIFKRN